MAIPLIREPDEEATYYNGLLERCHFCRTSTRWWHENTNNPVCQDCSKKHRVSELPDHGQRVRAMKRKKAKEAKRNDS